jgi:[ribosomal protein S18]-alanine N-acetyltransferase
MSFMQRIDEVKQIGIDLGQPESGKPSIHVRWLIRRDMPAVAEIEEASFEFPWRVEDFIFRLRQRCCIGMVAEVRSEVVGYMVYYLHKTRLHVLNFAVSTSFRRAGIGTAMVDKLVGKLSANGRNRITLEVRESNIDAQLFFRQAGFRAISIAKGYYEETAEDAYLLQYKLPANH